MPAIPESGNMPDLTARTERSVSTASACSRTRSGSTETARAVPRVFCTVIEVITVAAYAPQASIAFRSAWMPAPAEGSEPAIVRTTGLKTRSSSGMRTIIACVARAARRRRGCESLVGSRGRPRARELARYSRHLVLPEVGLEGQKRLRGASVLVVGAGLVSVRRWRSTSRRRVSAAWAWSISTAVDLSNLQRQILYGESDLERSKLSAAAERLAETNPHVALDLHETRLEASNALEILRPYDVIVDGTDNFATRFLVSDACVLLDKPNVYGSVYRFEGQASVFQAGKGPCYRCLFPAPPAPGSVPNCAEGGVLGVLPGIIGAIQATETIKLILGQGETLLGRLLLFDALEMRFRELALRKDPDCPVCGEHPTLRELEEIPATCAPAESRRRRLGDRRAQTGRVALERCGPGPARRAHARGMEHVPHRGRAVSLPLPELERRLDELDPQAEIVVYCHVGIRSAFAVELLRRNGFRAVRNLTGGIEAWAKFPSIPRCLGTEFRRSGGRFSPLRTPFRCRRFRRPKRPVDSAS